MDQPAHLPADRRAHKAPAALALLAALAFPASALAGPPQLTVSNRYETLDAALGSYSWCYGPPGSGAPCEIGDAFTKPKTEDTLPARGGDLVRIRPHVRTESIVAYTYAGDPYGTATHKDGKWRLRIKKGIGVRTDLVLSVQYANGRGGAAWGFGIHRAPTQYPPG